MIDMNSDWRKFRNNCDYRFRRAYPGNRRVDGCKKTGKSCKSNICPIRRVIE